MNNCLNYIETIILIYFGYLLRKHYKNPQNKTWTWNKKAVVVLGEEEEEQDRVLTYFQSLGTLGISIQHRYPLSPSSSIGRPTEFIKVTATDGVSEAGDKS